MDKSELKKGESKREIKRLNFGHFTRLSRNNQAEISVFEFDFVFCFKMCLQLVQQYNSFAFFQTTKQIQTEYSCT